MAMLIEENDLNFKANLDRYKYSDRHPQQSTEAHRLDCEAFLETLEERLTNTPYLYGDSLSYADIAIIPFIRQFSKVDLTWFSECRFNRLRDWLNKLETGKLFTSIMTKYSQWHEGDTPLIFKSPGANYYAN